MPAPFAPRPRHPSASRLALVAALASFALAPAAAGAAAFAATPYDSARIARMTDYIDRLEAFGFSGQVVVAEQGRVVLARAAGWADRRFAVPMTMDTRLGIGSVTKNFVAAAILRLEAMGRLKTTDRLDARLPGVPADKAAITLAQLLSHTSGIGHDVLAIPDRATRDEVVRLVLAEPLAGAPGGPFLYSNAGYDLLAAVVERASGLGLDAFVRRELLAPAGLGASGTAGSPDLPAGPAARGYNEWKEVSAWTEWPAGWKGTGSGRMVSTALDLWRWFEAVRGGKLLSAEDWSRMSTPHATQEDSSEYGFGIHIQATAGGGTLFTMGGDVDGYRAESRFYPAAGRTIIVLTNQDLFGLGVQRRSIANTLSRLGQGQFPPLPPAPLHRGTPAPGALREGADSPLGAWRLPSGGEIEIWEELGQWRLGARGQDAVDLFEPDAEDTTGARQRVKRDTETLIRAAANGDTALALSLLTREQFDFAYPFLSRRLATLGALYDGLQSVRGLGVVALPWDPNVRRAYAKFHFLDGDTDLFVGWEGKKLYDITFDEGRPFPVLYPVAEIADGGYAAYDVIRRREVRFRMITPQGGAPRLIFKAVGGDIAARRIR